MKKLLREAQNVYIRRDEEKQTQKAMIMSTIEQMTQNKAGL
jgi:hypothetical protein